MKKVSIIDFLSKSEQESHKTISYENYNASVLNLKISMNPIQDPGISSKSFSMVQQDSTSLKSSVQSQFQKYQNQSRHQPVKLKNLKLHHRHDSSEILETHRFMGDFV
jgi:hypothetical protein